MTLAKTKSVWLVNDDEYVRKMFAIMLTHGVTNIELTQFECSVRAWAAMAQDKPDLLITADTMVQMRGKEIAEQLFARGDTFPVIVTTGGDWTKEWVDTLFAKGMNIRLVDLPCEARTFWEMARQALGLPSRAKPAN